MRPCTAEEERALCEVVRELRDSGAGGSGPDSFAVAVTRKLEARGVHITLCKGKLVDMPAV